MDRFADGLILRCSLWLPKIIKASCGRVMMKKYFLPAVLIFCFVSIVTAENRYSDEHKEKVKKQHESDVTRRDALLEKMDDFISECNSAISGERVKLKSPVDPEFITDVNDTEEIHSGGVKIPAIYGYVNTGSLNMRSEESASSNITGKLAFRDRVEVIYQSDITETINKMQAPWLLVRRSNGDEGWVFGAYISSSLPSEPDRESGRTEWNIIIPASGKITSRYGMRVDPVTKRRKAFHKGIDIAAPAGTPVYAAADGVVSGAGYFKNGYGNLVVLKHGDSIATYYGHLSVIGVSRGAGVRKGDLIGKVGSTGKSTGPHLHFEVRRGGQALDPEGFMR